MTIPIGEKLWVKGDWDKRPVPAGRIPILIHPNPHAYGAGYNPSTQLVLTTLEFRLKPSDVVLDVGCGSGILAIGALKLGASKAILTDIEPVALEAARANMEINGLSSQALFLAESYPTLPDGSIDIVVSNIGEAVTKDYFQRCSNYLKPAGYFIFTGTTPELPAYELSLMQLGMVLIKDQLASDGLHALSYQKVA